MAGFDDIKDKSLLGRNATEMLKRRAERLKHESVEQKRLTNEILRATKESQANIQRLKADLHLGTEQRAEQIEWEEVEMASRLFSLNEQRSTASAALHTGVQKRFYGGTEQKLSPRASTERITHRQRSMSGFGGALRTSQSVSAQELESRVSRNRLRLEQQRERALYATENIDQPGMQQRYEKRLDTFGRIEEKIGADEAALTAMRKQGLDPASRHYQAAKIAGQVQSDRDIYQIKENVAAGRAGSREEVQDKLNRIGEKLIGTFEKLDEAVKSNSSDAARLGEEFRELEKQYSEAGQTAKEMDSGGGGMNWRMGAADMVNQAGVITQAGGQMYRYQQLTSELSQNQARMGLASLSNSRFFDELAATRGDAGALRRISTNTFGRQLERGRDFQGKEETALGTELVGKVGQTAASGVKGALAGSATGAVVGAALGAALGSLGFGAAAVPGAMAGAKIGSWAGGLLGAGAGATADLIQSHQMAVDLTKGTAGVQAGLAGASQVAEYENILNQVSDAATGQGIDTAMMIGRGTRGLGGGRDRESLAQLLADPQNQAALAEAGLGSIEEQSKVLSQSISQLGKQMTSEEGLGTMLRAGMRSRAGYFQDPSQYVAARGALTGVSEDSDRDLERILRQAVASGMDSSKHIMEMVSATKSLASGAAEMGFAVGEESGTALARARETMLNLGAPKDIATKAGASAAMTMKGIATGGHKTIATMMELSDLMSAFPMAEEEEIIAAQKADPDKLAKLKRLFKGGEKDPDMYAEARSKALDMGFGFLDETSDVERFQGITNKQQMGDLLGFTASADLKGKYRDYIEKGRTPEWIKKNDPRVYSVGQAAGINRYGKNTAAAVSAADYRRTPDEGEINLYPEGATVDPIERALRASGKGEAKLYGSITEGKDFEVKDWLDAMGTKMDTTADKLDPKKASDRAKESAENMEFPASNFSEYMSEFNGSIVRFTDGMEQITKIISDASKSENLSTFTREMGTITEKLRDINTGGKINPPWLPQDQGGTSGTRKSDGTGKND
jgi:hypothetical protein